MTYSPSRAAIVGRDRPHYNNRPLYCANTDAFVLTGDRPLARLAQGYWHLGTFDWGVRRGGTDYWLSEADSVVSSYTAGRMEWQIGVAALPGLRAELEVLPLASGVGLAAWLRTEGARADDFVVWRFGGVYRAPGGLEEGDPGPNLSWQLDVSSNPEWLAVGFRPEDALGDRVSAMDGVLLVRGPSDPSPVVTVTGPASGLPAGPGNWIWTVSLDGEEGEQSSAPRILYGQARERVNGLATRVMVETPDQHLDALVSASVAAVDGTWNPPVFVHGAMSWNRPLPGWRTLFGGTVYGWHDRVKAQASHYLPQQVLQSDKTGAHSDPAFLCTQEALDSRFYGRGYLSPDQKFYNMQSQFFDQLIHAWRSTADPELEAWLRPALELHLEWVADCFDPDGDGLYESYINTWPTDSVWYSGGGGVEETCYAFTGHRAARDLALRANDQAGVRRHETRLQSIRTAFRTLLWDREHGHPGLYREQGGHRRLHLDAWLYSVFLPIDAGLLSPEEALSALHFTEWALENRVLPDGGREVWTSNFVPGIWSVRELWPGDNYHLALAWFQAGFAEEGWSILQGVSRKTAYGGSVPGDLGSPQGGLDFGDCVHMFARVVVEGLFGYAPDYPNGQVSLSPQFPSSWDHARIQTPDFTLEYRRNADGAEDWQITLARSAQVTLRGPGGRTGTRFSAVAGVSTSMNLRPRPGLADWTREHRQVEAGQLLSVSCEGAADFLDPQGLLTGANLGALRLIGRVRTAVAHGTIFLIRQEAGRTLRRAVHLSVAQPADDSHWGERDLEVPLVPRWHQVPLNSLFNGDVRTIYQQNYLSPRPATVSVRLGTDGYSPWTFPHWKSLPPTINLDPGNGDLVTPGGVPFRRPQPGHNIVFTSLWDNYPTKVTIPAGVSGRGVWFLVCGSTNVMQGRIANAVLTLRTTAGTEDRLELVPPFNYWNLCPITSLATVAGQASRTDYTDPIDTFAVGAPGPVTIRLGENCRAVIVRGKLDPGTVLESVTLETLSPEVVVGLMGISVLQ